MSSGENNKGEEEIEDQILSSNPEKEQKPKSKKPQEYYHIYINIFIPHSHRLIIKAATWQRDSHGLFDYESHHIIKKNFKMVENGVIIRNGNEVENTDQQIIIGENDDGEKCNLLNVEAQNGNLEIYIYDLGMQLFYIYRQVCNHWLL